MTGSISPEIHGALSWVWSIERGVISGIGRQHFELNGSVTLTIGTLRRTHGHITITFTYAFGAGGEIFTGDGALEELKGCEGLVERHFVTGLVDAHKTEAFGLFDLPVDHVVRGADVHVAGRRKLRGVDLLGYSLAAEPVTL